jgi:hypothetical protein
MNSLHPSLLAAYVEAQRPLPSPRRRRLAPRPPSPVWGQHAPTVRQLPR